MALDISLAFADTYMRSFACAYVALLFSAQSFALNARSCEPEELSTALAGACLNGKLREEEKVLARKLNDLRQGIKRYDFSSNPEIDRQAKQDFLRALNEADKSWRALVASECLQLLAGDTFGGNGAVNAGLQCQLDRTTSRVVEIERSAPYQWIPKK